MRCGAEYGDEIDIFRVFLENTCEFITIVIQAEYCSNAIHNWSLNSNPSQLNEANLIMGFLNFIYKHKFHMAYLLKNSDY